MKKKPNTYLMKVIVIPQVRSTSGIFHFHQSVFEFKDFQVVVQRASRFDFSVARKNFDLPVFISKFKYKILILKVYRDAESVK